MAFLGFGSNDNIDKAMEYYRQGQEQAQQELKKQQEAGTTAIRGGVSAAGGLTQPYRQAGETAVGTYTGALGLGTPQQQQLASQSFRASPGYKWATDQAMQGIQRNLAARGLTGSGAEQKELGNYLTGAASQEYNNWLNNLRELTGIGQTSAESQAGKEYGAGGEIAGQALQYGTQGANIYQQTGQALAESELAKALQKQQGLSSLLNLGGTLGSGLLGYLGASPSSAASVSNPYAGGTANLTLDQLLRYM